MGNGQEEKFCLRWNDFENNISTSFRELRDDKDFFDVTLACDDNQLQAHKVILSACSPFFRSILKKNPHQHPLLYLKGVKYENILSVLNFMYHGEVNIAQEDLNNFLAVAEDLQVKGLTQNNQKQSPDTNQAHTTLKRSQDQLSPPSLVQRTPKQPRTTPALQTSRQIQDPVAQIKTEAPALVEIEEDDPTQMVLSSEYQTATSWYEDCEENYEEQFDENLAQVQVQVGETTRGWTVEKPFPCQHCDKSFSNKNSLQKHTKSHTGLTRCDICGKNFSTVPNLRAHVDTVHNKIYGNKF